VRLLVNRDDALKVIAHAAAVADGKGTLPILGSILLEAAGEVLRVSGTDLDRMASNECLAKVEKAGAAVAPAAALHEFIKALPAGGELLLVYDPAEDPRLQASCGRARMRSPTLPAADFPSFAELPAGAAEATLSAKVLAWMLATPQHAISREQTRPMLGGIHLHLIEVDGAPKLRAVATDGHQLGMAEIDPPAGLEKMPAIIIPRETVTEILRLLDGVDEDVELRATDKLVQLTLGAATITSKLLDYMFPDYVRVVPRDPPHSATLKKAGLEAAIKRLRCVQQARGDSVRISIDEGVCSLSAHSMDAGAAEDEIEAEADAPVKCGFNANYLANALGRIAGDEVVMRYSDGTRRTIARCC
jgi:DNA polymerase-3 subunit beta